MTVGRGALGGALRVRRGTSHDSLGQHGGTGTESFPSWLLHFSARNVYALLCALRRERRSPFQLLRKKLASALLV